MWGQRLQVVWWVGRKCDVGDLNVFDGCPREHGLPEIKGGYGYNLTCVASMFFFQPCVTFNVRGVTHCGREMMSWIGAYPDKRLGAAAYHLCQSNRTRDAL